MAREVKIKKSDGKFYEVKLPENYQAEFNKSLDRSKKNGETIIRETREYELITPLFGGGAENKKADEVSIIRATEIRGHLRFWWRATRGGQFNGNLKKMKDAEDAIFGSTENHSPLQIEIVLTEDYKERKKENEAKKETAFYLESGTGKVRSMQNISLYAAFSLQPTDEEKNKGWEKSEVCEEVKLRLEISFPETTKIYKKGKDGKLIKDENGKFIVEKSFDSSEEIQSALWAWENFGGIGARTRRGFGALKLIKVNEVVQENKLFESKENLIESAKEHIYGGKVPKGVPYLGKTLRFVISNEGKNATEVWKELIDKYKKFRQQRTEDVYRVDGRRKVDFGRSHWNEPEAIRELTGQRFSYHDKDEELCFEKFPRAEFGLPIVFKFNSKDTWERDKRRLRREDLKPDGKDYDPRKTNLSLTDYERFSSPLILRPLACKNGNFVGLALILENETTLDELGLTLEAQENQKVKIKNGLKSKLSKDEAAKIIRVDNGEPLISEVTNDKPDVLKSFLKYLEN